MEEQWKFDALPIAPRPSAITRYAQEILGFIFFSAAFYNIFMKSRALSCIPARRTIGTALTACVVVSAWMCACQNQSVARTAFPKTAELQQITSPNGQFDAVLVSDSYGPAAGGGVDSNVYVVRKGSPVYAEPGQEIFNADPMSDGKLVWRGDHLLEIRYDIAYIHRFRNVWGLHQD